MRLACLRNSKWVALTVVSIGTLTSTLDSGMVGVAYPALAKDLKTETSTVVWVTVAFWVTNVGLLLILGWTGDVLGRRRVFVGGFLVFTLGIMAAAVSLNVWQLILARIFQGVGSSMLLSNLNALIVVNFPDGERGKAMGISGSIVGVGLTLGPLLGGWLLEVLDWRALFYSRVPLGVVGSVLAWVLLPRDRIRLDRSRIDLLGAGSLLGILITALLVVNQGGRLGFTSPLVIGMVVVSGVLIPVLLWSERRSARPIVGFTLLKSRQYAVGLLSLICHYVSHGAIMLAAPFFFLDSLGFSATKMGVFVAAFFVGRTFLAPYAGRLSDKFGPRPFLVVGNILLVGALLWMNSLSVEGLQWGLFFAMLLAGVGSGFFEPVVTSFIMGSVSHDRLGTASASVALGRHVAFAVGVAVAGAIFTVRERLYLTSLSIPSNAEEIIKAEAIARGFADTALAGAIVAGGAVALSFFVRSSESEP